jgi:hypothetical protein
MTEIDDVSVQAETPVAASVGDTLRVGAVVIVPTFAAGVIKRRPGVMALADRFQLDKPAIRLLQRLRRKYGAVPLSLRSPGRSLALLLSGEQVGVLLEESPSPSAPLPRRRRRRCGISSRTGC